MVKGDFNLQKLLKTLKKKTGKKIEVSTKNEKSNVLQKENDEEPAATVKIEDNKDETVPQNHDQPETSLEKLSLDTKEAVEFSIPFLCDQYEKSFGKVISKFKGVESYALDIENKKVLVISKGEGNFDKDELIEELGKKMHKKAEKIRRELMLKEAEESKRDDDGIIYIQPSYYEEDIAEFSYIFSDANPNGCCIS